MLQIGLLVMPAGATVTDLEKNGKFDASTEYSTYHLPSPMGTLGPPDHCCIRLGILSSSFPSSEEPETFLQHYAVPRMCSNRVRWSKPLNVCPHTNYHGLIVSAKDSARGVLCGAGIFTPFIWHVSLLEQ